MLPYGGLLLDSVVLVDLACASIALAFVVWNLFLIARAHVRKIRVSREKRHATLVRLPTPRPFMATPYGRRAYSGHSPAALRAMQRPHEGLATTSGDNPTSSLADDLQSRLIGGVPK